MTSLADLFPPLGLTLTAGPLMMRGISDEMLPELCELARRGIHDPGEMPFYVPWTDVPEADLARNTAAYHWRSRAEFSTSQWGLHLAVLHEGRLVGTQGFKASDCLVTCTGETGSWLGREFQVRGTGTAMRQAICAFAFDHLDAEEITSGAFLDNPASLAVSRNIGYRPHGVRRLKRRQGELALNQSLVLARGDFERGEDALVVDGLARFRAVAGLG